MKKNYLKTFSSCALFRNLDQGQTEKIAEASTTVHLKKGETLFCSEHYIKALVIILSGTFSVTKSEGGSRILMNVLSSGDIFGMAGLFCEEEGFITDITANSAVAAAVIEKEKLLELFSKYPQISENYITILSEKIHFLNKRVQTCARADTLSKVADVILQCADSKKTCAVLPFPLTKLSEYVSAGRASVYRALGVLEGSDIIKRSGRSIEILDADALKNIYYGVIPNEKN